MLYVPSAPHVSTVPLGYCRMMVPSGRRTSVPPPGSVRSSCTLGGGCVVGRGGGVTCTVPNGLSFGLMTTAEPTPCTR